MTETKLVSEARVATPLARRYMTQLCKHFEHKLPVTYTTHTGRIEFQAGLCLMEAQDETLVLRAEAGDAEGLDRLENVVVKHLERFAFRDKPAVNWVRA